MNETRVERDLFQARLLTIPAPSGPPADAARELFGKLAKRLRDESIAPIQEKIYAPVAHRDEVLRIRREVFASHGIDPELPATCTSGRRDDDLGLTGVQVLGVSGAQDAPVRVSTVRAANGVAGRLLEAPDLRMLHLAGVHGGSGTSRPPGVFDEATAMFERAGAALREFGFGFRAVARTWIYLARLLDWYGEFNRARAAFLGRAGITDQDMFPASTGIQGTDGSGECLMDVLAVDGDGAVRSTIADSSRQRRPMSYGSSFSRGMRLRLGSEDWVFVSGTASIDAGGQTLYCWQREAQILETLLGVAALLEDQGGGLRDIRLATLFCKDRETLEIFRRVTRQLGIPRLPAVPVLADVCRPELMVEIEAMAVLPPRPQEAASHGRS